MSAESYPFFHKARLIDHEDPIRFSHTVSDHMRINLQHPWLILRDVADPTLHRSYATGIDLQGNRFNGLACEHAELPHQVTKAMVPQLAPSKALPEGRMQCTEYVEAPLDLTGADIELRKCIGSLVIPGVHNSMIFWTNKAYPYKSNWILWNKCVTFNIP
jgi:hypothetical protein